MYHQLQYIKKDLVYGISLFVKIRIYIWLWHKLMSDMKIIIIFMNIKRIYKYDLTIETIYKHIIINMIFSEKYLCMNKKLDQMFILIFGRNLSLDNLILSLYTIISNGRGLRLYVEAIE